MNFKHSWNGSGQQSTATKIEPWYKMSQYFHTLTMNKGAIIQTPTWIMDSRYNANSNTLNSL